MVDFLLKGGIQFSPRDIDTKSIVKAVTAATSNIMIRITKVHLADPVIKSLVRDIEQRLKITIDHRNFMISGADIGARIQKAIEGAGRKYLLDIAINKQSLKAQIQQVLASMGAQIVPVKAAPAPGAAGIAVPGKAAPTAIPATTTTAGLAAQLQAKAAAVQAEKELLATTPQVVKSQEALNQILKNSGQSAEVFGAKMGQITARFGAYFIAIKGILAIQNAFNQSLQAIVQFDNTIQDLNKVLNETPAGLQKVAESMFQIATATGKAFDEVGVAMNQFIRQGLGVAKAMELTKAAMIATNVTELDSAQATQFLTTVYRVYEDSAKDLVGVLDILTATSDNAATTAGQVADAFINSGAAAKAVGLSYQELFAITAATIDRLQQSGSRVGTALKTIFSRLVTMNDKIREQANAWGANIQVGDGVVDMFNKLSAVWGRLDIFQRGQLAYLVAGRRRFSELAGILEGFNKAQSLLAVQQNAAGTAMRKNQIELDKLSTRAQILSNTWNELIQVVGGTEGGARGVGLLRNILGDILGLATNVSQVLLSVAKALRTVEIGGTTVSTIFSAIAKTAFFTIGLTVIRGIISGLKQFFALGQLIHGLLVSIGQKQQGVNQGISQSNVLLSQHIRLQNQQINNVNAMSAAWKQQGISMRQYTQALQALQKGKGPGTAGGIKQIAVLGTIFLGAQIAADNLTKLSENIKQSSGDLTRLDTALLDSATSTLNFGTILAATIGPTAGVIGGLVIGLTKLTYSILAMDAATQDNLVATEKAAAVRTSAGEIIARKGSELLINAAQDLAGGVKGAQVSVESALVKAFGDSTSIISKALSNTSEIISRMNDEVNAAIRSVDIAQTLREFGEDFRMQMGAIDLKLQLGGSAGVFDDILKSISEAQSKTETLTGTQMSQVELYRTMLDVSEALNQVSDKEAGSATRILEIYGLQSAKVQELNEHLTETKNKLSAQYQILNAAKQEATKLTEENQKYTKEQEERLKKASAEGKGYAAITDLQNNLARIAELRTNKEKEIVQIDEKINQLLSIENKLSEQQQQAVEENVKALTDIVKAKEKILLTTDLELKKIQLVTQQYEIQALEAQKQIALRNKLIQMTLAPQNFGSDIARAIAEANGEAQNAIAARRDEQIRATQIVEQSIAAAQAAGDKEAVNNFKQRLEQMKSLFPKELEALKSKLDVDIILKLQQDYVKSIQEQEQGLRDFRVEQIRQAIDAEKAAADRRMDFIKQAAVGPEFARVFRDQLRNLPNELKDIFGDSGALIITEQERISAMSIAALKAQYDETFKNVQASNQKIRAAQELSAQIIVEMEKTAALRRATILEQVKNSAKKADDAESRLVEARNKIPALNSAVINSEKQLSDARQGYVSAVSNFFQASQAAADAQVQYNYELQKSAIGIAQTTAGAGDFNSVLTRLQGAWQTVVTGIKASEEKILSIRADIAQQALSIYQQQFNALKGLAQRAATGTVEELAKLRAIIGAGKAVAGGANIMAIPEELRSGLTQVANVIPGLEQALTEQGARLLGLDPRVFQSLESQMTEAAKAVAETGKTTVDAANKQVMLSMTQIAKADEQIRQAKESLNISIKQRDLTEAQVSQLSSANALAHVQYNASVNNAIRQIDRLGSIDASSKLMNEVLKNINLNIQEMVQELKNSIATDRAALQSLGGGKVPNAAYGTLTNSEIGGIISAARREKSAMPPGARLMLANTSEVVLNRNQASRMNLRPIPKAYAADGNADAGGGVSAANALTAAVNTLVNRLNQPGLVEQNINVQVDSERTLNVRGMEAIDAAIRRAFQEKMAGVASAEEQKAIENTVKGLVERLHELNIVEARGL